MNHCLIFKQYTAKIIATLALLALAAPSQGAPRSAAVRAEFQRLNPCPANGKTRGACPGWVKDHRVGLCVGGADEVSNMRWMTVAAAQAKDRWECRTGWEGKLAACERDGCFVESPLKARPEAGIPASGPGRGGGGGLAVELPGDFWLLPPP